MGAQGSLRRFGDGPLEVGASAASIRGGWGIYAMKAPSRRRAVRASDWDPSVSLRIHVPDQAKGRVRLHPSPVSRTGPPAKPAADVDATPVGA